MPLLKLGPWQVVLGLAMLSPALAGCHPSYSATSITARVLDADTKEPLEGVIVVADWRLEGGPEGASPGQLTVLETVSDPSGVFHFPAWGPKQAFDGWLGNRDPVLLLFKDGYQFTAAGNPFRGLASDMPTGTRSSVYDGKVVEMRKFVGDLREWARNLDELSIQVDFATRGRCEWRSIPRLLRALKRQSGRLAEAGIYSGTFYDSVANGEQYYATQGCGSVRQFIGDNAE